MKRLFVLSSEFPPGPGGIGTHAFEITCSLKKRGWEAAVVTSQHYVSAGTAEKFNAEQSFKIVRFKDLSPFFVEALYRARILHKQIEAWRPDVLIATGDRSVWLSAFLLRKKKIPWIAMGHGGEFGVKGFEKGLSSFAFSSADAVICVSRRTRQKMLEMGIKPRRDFVIHNGANPDIFRVLPNNRPEELRGITGKILMTVGSLSERKGQDIVIRALPEILKKNPDVYYVMVGFPAIKEKLEKLALSLGLKSRVRFLEAKTPEKVAQLLNASDVYVLTSRTDKRGDFEGFGISVIEAALCGVPAVVSRCGGLPEAVEEGKTGLLVPENDPASVAHAVNSLLEQQEKCRAMGNEARKRALEFRTWDAVAGEYDHILKMVIDEDKKL